MSTRTDLPPGTRRAAAGEFLAALMAQAALGDALDPRDAEKLRRAAQALRECERDILPVEARARG